MLGFVTLSNKPYKIVSRTFCFGELMQLGKLCVFADGEFFNVKQQHPSKLQRFASTLF